MLEILFMFELVAFSVVYFMIGYMFGKRNGAKPWIKLVHEATIGWAETTLCLMKARNENIDLQKIIEDQKAEILSLKPEVKLEG